MKWKELTKRNLNFYDCWLKQNLDLNESVILCPLNLDVQQPELLLADLGLGCWEGGASVRVDEVLQQLHISEKHDEILLTIISLYNL